MIARVFVFGAGRAGRALARALRASGEVDVVGVHGRRRPAQLLPDEVAPTIGTVDREIERADTVLVTVQDAQLGAALDELAALPLASGAVVLHASGSHTPPELQLLTEQGHPTGTFHPLVPLADPARGPDRLRGCWVGIDGAPAAMTRARILARALGAHVLEIPSGRKTEYHAAAVLAANFPVVLVSLAERVLGDIGLPPDRARDALGHLLLATAENVRAAGASQALTGPVARGDVETVRAHLGALVHVPEARAVYAALSRAALPMAAARGTDPARLAAIAAALDIVEPGARKGATAEVARQAQAGSDARR